MNHDNCTHQKGMPWWRTPAGLACLALVTAAGAWLLIEHWLHVQSYLPYVLLAACPLLHVFGHRHGAHGHGIEASATKTRDGAGTKSG